MYKLSIYLIVLFWMGTVTIARAQYSETKEVKRTFEVSEEMSMEVSNKYGRVEIEVWDKDSVRIEIKMEVKERKLSRLHKALDNIRFDVSKSTRRIWARTQFGRGNSVVENELFRLKESMSRNGSSSTKVDYRIFMPAYIDLTVENKFGDVYIDDFNSNLNVELSNGKLKAHNLSGRVRLNLFFGGATVSKMGDGRVMSNYSNVFIRKAGKLYVSSKSSDIEFDQVRNLSVDSRRDKFRIGEMDTLITESSFTDFRIDQVVKMIDANLRYGDFQLNSVVKDFDKIKLTSKMADVGLFFNNDCAFNFSINHSKLRLNTGSAFKLEKEENHFHSNEYYTKGRLGTPEGEDVKVRISTTGGQLSLDLE
ncbi:hypothetical protein EMN47_15370 [Prolixibacteraceae bacterium JC049]|nr:hypothetical protein [Prolixibacteraceae bacterium JC049]